MNILDFKDTINEKNLKLKEYIKEKIVLLENPVAPQKAQDIKPIKSYKTEIWFEVGLLFAIGEMDKLIKEHGRNATLIAKKTNPKYNKSILATMNNYNKNNTNGEKNIYNSRDKMQKIIEHCKLNDIVITSDFSNLLPTD